MSKTILITGASTGLGAETARHLASGNRLILHYNRSKDAVERVAADVRAAGGEAHLARAELSTQDGCRQLIGQVSDVTDHLDVLFNNAGSMIKRQAADEYEWELLKASFALNVFSVMYLTSGCYQLLKKGTNPCVVNNTSVAMRHGAPSATIYGATKSALDSWTRGLAKEWSPDIRVNAVAPGVIVTSFHDKFSGEDKLKEFAKATPLKRNGAPHNIASAVSFLIENDFITGETIDVNGGIFMR